MSDQSVNVTTEAALRKNLISGGQIELTCKASPSRRGSVWYGAWVIHSIEMSGQSKALVTARGSRSDGDIKVRVFKTATGLISFLQECGFSEIRFPFVEDQTIRIALPIEPA